MCITDSIDVELHADVLTTILNSYSCGSLTHTLLGMDADESYHIQDHIQPPFADSCFATHYAIITACAIYNFVRKLCAYPNTLHFLLQKKYQILGQDVWGQIPMEALLPKLSKAKSLEHLLSVVAQLANDKCANCTSVSWDL